MQAPTRRREPARRRVDVADHCGGARMSSSSAVLLGRRPLATTTAPNRLGLASAWSWLLPPIVLFGFLLRLAAADRFPPHVHEGNMLLGITTVAHRGWPLLPSDVLNIHGATLSYLLAPLAQLGLLDYLHPLPMRLPSAIFGPLAVSLTDRLGRAVLGAAGPAVFAALLVAV